MENYKFWKSKKRQRRGAVFIAALFTVKLFVIHNTQKHRVADLYAVFFI
jgi:hypothetical protein